LLTKVTNNVTKNNMKTKDRHKVLNGTQVIWDFTSLLGKFIRSKFDKYREPERKGIPRGEKIGFSKKKFYASLLMLLNYKQSKIADKVGISHSLLRKWNTEKEFKEQVDKNCYEFIDFIYSTIDIYVIRILEGSSAEDLDKMISKLYFDFSDGFVYGFKLRNGIRKMIEDTINEIIEDINKKNDNDDKLEKVLSIIENVLFVLDLQLNPKNEIFKRINENVQKKKSEMKNYPFYLFKKVIYGEELDNLEKKDAISLFENLIGKLKFSC